jgi:hypothetical protein
MAEEDSIVIEKEGVSKDDLNKILEDHTKKILEAITPQEKTKSETEPLDDSTPADYRVALTESLKTARETSGWKWTGPEDNEEAKKTVGEVKVTDKKLQEAIGPVTATNAVPEVWAAEVERLSQYPASAFWNAPYITWKKDIQGKPGDTVNVITVAPVTCADLACEEPTNTAATVGKVPITLANKVCAYYICKTDMEDVVPDTIDALNEGLSRCLSVCVDNYFLTQALIGSNAGTLTEAGMMKGTVIAKAMGSMEAGTYEPAVLIMHPIVYKGLFQDSQFTNAATFGNRSVIQQGEIDSYLGVQMVSIPKGTLAVGGGTYRSLLLAKGAIAGAKKHEIELETEYVARLQRKYVLASARFGGTVVHPNGVFWILTVQS